MFVHSGNRRSIHVHAFDFVNLRELWIWQFEKGQLVSECTIVNLTGQNIHEYKLVRLFPHS